MEQEIWKDIENYEGIYQVSNLGHVKNLISSVQLKPCLNEKGYARVCLTKFGVTKQFKMHRLVAKAFIPNPNNKPEINHINHIRNDNRVQNLEWATRIENMKELRPYSDLPRKGHKVAHYTNGVLDGVYVSIADASRKTGITMKALDYCVKYSRFGWVSLKAPLKVKSKKALFYECLPK